MNLRKLFALVAFALTSIIAFAADDPKANEQRVREYVAAFNDRKIDTMLTMVTDDIQWLSVEGDKISVETQGKEKLRASMASYFKSNPSTKSTLDWVQATKARVAALEKASWESKSGPRAQSSLSIYEFRGALIARVYYYPAEK